MVRARRDRPATSSWETAGPSPLAQLGLAFLRSLRENDVDAALATIRRWLDAVARVLEGPDGAARLIVLWSYVLQVTDVPADRLSAVVEDAGQGAMMSFISTAQRLRTEGRVELLERQLTRRFGPLPQAIVDRLRTAQIEQLDHWAEAILTATSLDALFEP